MYGSWFSLSVFLLVFNICIAKANPNTFRDSFPKDCVEVAMGYKVFPDLESATNIEDAYEKRLNRSSLEASLFDLSHVVQSRLDRALRITLWFEDLNAPSMLQQSIAACAFHESECKTLWNNHVPKEELMDGYCENHIFQRLLTLHEVSKKETDRSTQTLVQQINGIHKDLEDCSLIYGAMDSALIQMDMEHISRDFKKRCFQKTDLGWFRKHDLQELEKTFRDLEVKAMHMEAHRKQIPFEHGNEGVALELQRIFKNAKTFVPDVMRATYADFYLQTEAIYGNSKHGADQIKQSVDYILGCCGGPHVESFLVPEMYRELLRQIAGSETIAKPIESLIYETKAEWSQEDHAEISRWRIAYWEQIIANAKQTPFKVKTTRWNAIQREYEFIEKVQSYRGDLLYWGLDLKQQFLASSEVYSVARNHACEINDAFKEAQAVQIGIKMDEWVQSDPCYQHMTFYEYFKPRTGLISSDSESTITSLGVQDAHVQKFKNTEHQEIIQKAYESSQFREKNERIAKKLGQNIGLFFKDFIEDHFHRTAYDRNLMVLSIQSGEEKMRFFDDIRDNGTALNDFYDEHACVFYAENGTQMPVAFCNASSVYQDWKKDFVKTAKKKIVAWVDAAMLLPETYVSNLSAKLSQQMNMVNQYCFDEYALWHPSMFPGYKSELMDASFVGNNIRESAEALSAIRIKLQNEIFNNAQFGGVIQNETFVDIYGLDDIESINCGSRQYVFSDSESLRRTPSKVIQSSYKPYGVVSTDIKIKTEAVKLNIRHQTYHQTLKDQIKVHLSELQFLHFNRGQRNQEWITSFFENSLLKRIASLAEFVKKSGNKVYAEYLCHFIETIIEDVFQKRSARTAIIAMLAGVGMAVFPQAGLSLYAVCANLAIVASLGGGIYYTKADMREMKARQLLFQNGIALGQYENLSKTWNIVGLDKKAYRTEKIFYYVQVVFLIGMLRPLATASYKYLIQTPIRGRESLKQATKLRQYIKETILEVYEQHPHSLEVDFLLSFAEGRMRKVSKAAQKSRDFKGFQKTLKKKLMQADGSATQFLVDEGVFSLNAISKHNKLHDQHFKYLLSQNTRQADDLIRNYGSKQLLRQDQLDDLASHNRFADDVGQWEARPIWKQTVASARQTLGKQASAAKEAAVKGASKKKAAAKEWLDDPNGGEVFKEAANKMVEGAKNLTRPVRRKVWEWLRYLLKVVRGMKDAAWLRFRGGLQSALEKADRHPNMRTRVIDVLNHLSLTHPERLDALNLTKYHQWLKSKHELVPDSSLAQGSKVKVFSQLRKVNAKKWAQTVMNRIRTTENLSPQVLYERLIQLVARSPIDDPIFWNTIQKAITQHPPMRIGKDVLESIENVLGFAGQQNRSVDYLRWQTWREGVFSRASDFGRNAEGLRQGFVSKNFRKIIDIDVYKTAQVQEKMLSEDYLSAGVNWHRTQLHQKKLKFGNVGQRKSNAAQRVLRASGDDIDDMAQIIQKFCAQNHVSKQLCEQTDMVNGHYLRVFKENIKTEGLDDALHWAKIEKQTLGRLASGCRRIGANPKLRRYLGGFGGMTAGIYGYAMYQWVNRNNTDLSDEEKNWWAFLEVLGATITFFQGNKSVNIERSRGLRGSQNQFSIGNAKVDATRIVPVWGSVHSLAVKNIEQQRIFEQIIAQQDTLSPEDIYDLTLQIFDHDKALLLKEFWIDHLKVKLLQEKNQNIQKEDDFTHLQDDIDVLHDLFSEEKYQKKYQMWIDQQKDKMPNYLLKDAKMIERDEHVPFTEQDQIFAMLASMMTKKHKIEKKHFSGEGLHDPWLDIDVLMQHSIAAAVFFWIYFRGRDFSGYAFSAALQTMAVFDIACGTVFQHPLIHYGKSASWIVGSSLMMQAYNQTLRKNTIKR